METTPLNPPPAPETAIVYVSQDNPPAAGKILSTACQNSVCRLPAVMSETATNAENLQIDGFPQNKINLLSL
ncbi:MAG: hypothetical protein CTY29_09185 [Methylobacter sp.]|nr:MAG: hypothetical protein CTY29_09185 [Methylobacter sp.]